MKKHLLELFALVGVLHLATCGCVLPTDVPTQFERSKPTPRTHFEVTDPIDLNLN